MKNLLEDTINPPVYNIIKQSMKIMASSTNAVIVQATYSEDLLRPITRISCKVKKDYHPRSVLYYNKYALTVMLPLSFIQIRCRIVEAITIIRPKKKHI
jgi:hypothetical protein